MSTNMAVKRNDSRYAGTPEWYTPAWLLDRITAFLGPGWYDPCPASYGKPAQNGLAASWAGKRVYCNPPYGRGIETWIRKAATEPTRELILLLPAYTDTRWFTPLFSFGAVLFIHGRIYFERMGETGRPAPHPSVLVYRGRRWRAFADAFCDLGPVMRTAVPMRAKQPELQMEASA